MKRLHVFVLAGLATYFGIKVYKSIIRFKEKR